MSGLAGFIFRRYGSNRNAYLGNQYVNNPIRLAKLTFSVGAGIGILGIGGACLYIAAYDRHSDVWSIFYSIFVPFSALWALFCYSAYRGLTSANPILKLLFWSCVVFNAFGFPIGTGIAGVAVWLWRDLRIRRSGSLESE